MSKYDNVSFEVSIVKNKNEDIVEQKMQGSRSDVKYAVFQIILQLCGNTKQSFESIINEFTEIYNNNEELINKTIEDMERS